MTRNVRYTKAMTSQEKVSRKVLRKQRRRKQIFKKMREVFEKILCVLIMCNALAQVFFMMVFGAIMVGAYVPSHLIPFVKFMLAETLVIVVCLTTVAVLALLRVLAKRMQHKNMVIYWQVFPQYRSFWKKRADRWGTMYWLLDTILRGTFSVCNYLGTLLDDFI